MLFTEKYYPKGFDDFVGNAECVDRIKVWAQDWNQGKRQKAILLVGNVGVGKTLLAHLVAKEMNWELFETNASSLRNKDAIEKISGAASQSASLWGGKKLLLIDEIDCLQAQDRGGSTAIANIIKETANPIILTANDVYADKKMGPIRNECEVIDFKKINQFTITRKLKEIAGKEGIEFEEEAIKELAKNCAGDYRSALLDLQAGAPKITLADITESFQRQRKEKIFNVLSKIFHSKTAKEAIEAADSAEVDPNMLAKWVEENIPRQLDEEDAAKAFDALSRADIFNGRIMRRQHWGFLKYNIMLATAGVAMAKTKESHKWIPMQFPSLLSSLSGSTGKREAKKNVAEKIAEKTHCSIRDGIKEIPIIKILFEKKENALSMIHYYGFDEDNVAFLMDEKKGSKKAVALYSEAKAIEKKKVFKKTKGQATLFG
jgi:replication factor C large subunit